MFGFREKSKMIAPERALRGRQQEMPVADRHAVLGTPMRPPFPEGFEQLVVGMGCFWGAERVFWQAEGVYTTAVGYAGGYTPNPTYEEVCSGSTGHAEVVLVVFDPAKTTYEQMLALFWENHNPTQGMRQGNDRGTQYRSAIYWDTDRQRELAMASRDAYNELLQAQGYSEITTEIAEAGPFYYAEDYHQQYLEKNPRGYCGLGGTGVSCPVGLGVARPGRDRRPGDRRCGGRGGLEPEHGRSRSSPSNAINRVARQRASRSTYARTQSWRSPRGAPVLAAVSCGRTVGATGRTIG